MKKTTVKSPLNETPLHVPGQGNTAASNSDGGIQLEATGGHCQLADIYGNLIGGSSMDNSNVGIRLTTSDRDDPVNPSKLAVELSRNRIFYMNGSPGNGLEIISDDEHSNSRLIVESNNDRVCLNSGKGVYINYPLAAVGSTLGVNIGYMTCCDNTGGGLYFDDVNIDASVDVFNSIFVDNGSYDINTNFKGDISYSDWLTGYLNGGSGHSSGKCLEADPIFSDILYHLTWDPPIQSPCIDKGDDNAAPRVYEDMEGHNRRIEVIPNPQMDTDMGADEHKPD